MKKFLTADLCDQYSEMLVCSDPVFQSFGIKQSFYGEIVTLKLFEDNSLVRKVLSNNGKGKVLIVDGGESLRCALVGDQLAELVIINNWEGVIINGCIRDSLQINKMQVGIKALNTCPVKSIKRNSGKQDIVVKFASVEFKPGEFVYSDNDGLLISEKLLL